MCISQIESSDIRAAIIFYNAAHVEITKGVSDRNLTRDLGSCCSARPESSAAKPGSVASRRSACIWYHSARRTRSDPGDLLRSREACSVRDEQLRARDGGRELA